jgi:hypothetical protein
MTFPDNAGPVRSATFQRDLEALRTTLAMTANFQHAVLGGLGAALLCASVWGAAGALLGYDVGFMAVVAGVACGLSVRLFGKGVTNPFGVVGVATTAAACLLGHFLMVVGIIAGEQSLTLLQVIVGIDYRLAFDTMIAFVGPLDGLFCGIGFFQAYRLSFRSLTPPEIALITGREHPE